jgi:drug/metabolite transporter (DMT)-like permease
MILILGLILSSVSAIIQASTYIVSKHILAKHPGSSIQLLVVAHLFMGLFSIVALCFLWTPVLVHIHLYLISLICGAFFYFFAQSLFLSALHFSEPSRLAPLLGIKVFFLAIFSIFLLSTPLTALQWVAISLTIIAGFVLNNTGAPPPWKSLVLIIFTCIFFALSDINCKILVKHLQAANNDNFLGITQMVSLVYLGTGILSLPLLFYIKRPTKIFIKETFLYASLWYLGAIFMFSAYAFISVILVAIIQSTRGVINVVLGVFIAKAGFEHLEKKVEKSIVKKRIFAASLMTLAIILFVLAK